MTPNKQLKTTTVWRGDWTIGQNLNSIGTDGANDKNLIILYIIIYNIINII